jgi:hypothetical protein
MAATCQLKCCIGASAATETPDGDASNWNMMTSDAYSGTDTLYQTYPITVDTDATAYSYERWLRLKFTGTFNKIENVTAYKSAGSLSDAELAINAGETDTGATPTDAGSTVATQALPTASGSAIDITPAAGISSSGDKTDYLVAQLVVPTTVTTPGDIGSQTMTFTYDES